jgi:hypothetical protein
LADYITATTGPKLLRSAKGADARRQTAKELAKDLGGAPDTAPLLREFLNSIKNKKRNF